VEVINTDAEGRLVLADAVTYVQRNYKPSTIIDLATLTGAILISLGHEWAGLFSNDETLADIVAALKPDLLQLHGSESPERVVTVRTRFGLPVMKALPIAERADLSPIRLYGRVADRLIFDARAPKEATRPGGLGTPFDWTLLRDVEADDLLRAAVGLEGEVARGQAAHGISVAVGDPHRDLDERDLRRLANGAAVLGARRPGRESRGGQKQQGCRRLHPETSGSLGADRLTRVVSRFGPAAYGPPLRAWTSTGP